MHYKINKSKAGFLMIELLVGVTVFTIIAIAVYGAYTSIFNTVYISRSRLEAVDLSNELLEVVRNLPYSDVGVSGGIPNGKLLHNQTLTRGGSTFDVTTTVRNVDDPFDGTLGGTPNDLSPADFKLVEIEINCAQCQKFTPIVVTTRVAPKNLETASTNGALFVRVFDANGNPVSDANVHIENSSATPPIVIDDVTNVNGMLQIVDAPPGVNAYDIQVTKSGYSTDKTYQSTVSNPNPSKPRATVALQKVTQLSFVIDRTSTLSVNSVTQTCTPVGSIDFNLKGGKVVGTVPDVLKYDSNKVTSAGGLLSINNLEWDTYSFTLIDAVYELIGVNPTSPINLLPNSTQSLQLVVAPKNPRTVFVMVKDSVSNLPVSDVDVTISKAGFTSVTSATGQGYITQTDWSGGSGQATTTDFTRYSSSDGNVEVGSPAGDMVLRTVFGEYVYSGYLESSSFDTGSISNFQKILWTPVDQPVGAGTPNVRFQIATNNTGANWDFRGPDNTSSTYYTTSNQNINSANNGNQFLRYKVFLDTVSTTSTPNISDVSFTYTSQCTPPGQVYFSGLPSGTYNLHLTKAGYVTQVLELMRLVS
jgi:nitrate reductase NapE component